MRFLRWFLIAALVALAFHHLKPHFADFRQIPTILREANYFYLLIAAVAIIGQYIGDGWLSQTILRISGHRININQTIKIASIDVFAAHLLPLGEIGTAATTAYFYKKLGVTSQGIIFLNIAWGISTNIVLFAFLLIALTFLPKLPDIPIHVSTLAKIILLIILALSITATLFRKKIYSLVYKKFAKYSLFFEIKKFMQDLSNHKKSLRQNKILIAQAMFAALLYYLANIASLYFCFLTFHTTPNLALVTSAYLLSLVVSFLTLTPAGIGTSEAVMILIFLQFNVNPAIATASVLVFRLFAFWLPLPAGFISYMSLKNAKIPQNT